MPWAKVSDTAPMDPRLISVIEHDLADDRATNELYGFYGRLVGLSGQHLTDYVVSYGTVLLVAGTKGNAERLLVLGAYTGMVTEVEEEGTGRRAFKLLDDPEFWHIKLADEIAWERQRQSDNRNPAITAPVRRRDGDACRYCAKVVNWRARKGKLAGTYDHRPPGQPGSVETSVVACGECNARRGSRPVAVADLELPLLAVPTAPYFHADTVEYLRGHEAILAQHGMNVPALPKAHQNLTPGQLAPGAQAAPTPGVRRAAAPEVPDAPSRQQQDRPAPAATDPARAPLAPVPQPPSADQADPGRFRQITGVDDQGLPGRVGSGRDGSGGAGPARRPEPAPRPSVTSTPNPARRRRGARGGRRKTQGES